MFDANSYVNSNITNKFQQSQGSLMKTHPDSIFLWFEKGSKWCKSFFSPKPSIEIKEKGFYSDIYIEYPITVLQVMLLSSDAFICEIVIHKGENKNDK